MLFRTFEGIAMRSTVCGPYVRSTILHESSERQQSRSDVNRDGASAGSEAEGV